MLNLKNIFVCRLGAVTATALYFFRPVWQIVCRGVEFNLKRGSKMKKVMTEVSLVGVLLFCFTYFGAAKTFGIVLSLGLILVLCLVVFFVYLDSRTRVVVCKKEPPVSEDVGGMLKVYDVPQKML